MCQSWQEYAPSAYFIIAPSVRPILLVDRGSKIYGIYRIMNTCNSKDQTRYTAGHAGRVDQRLSGRQMTYEIIYTSAILKPVYKKRRLVSDIQLFIKHDWSEIQTTAAETHRIHALHQKQADKTRRTTTTGRRWIVSPLIA